MGLGDVDKTAKFRDIVRRLIRSEVDLIRPRPKYGLVLSHNAIARRAMVLFNGDTEPTEVIAPNGLQPATTEADPGVTHGCIVKVQGTAGNYWISEVVKGAELHSSPNLLLPTFRGGTFGQQRMTTVFGKDVEQPSAIGNWRHVGRWECPKAFITDMTGYVRIVISLPGVAAGSVSLTKTYQFPVKYNATGATWRRVFPDDTTGASNGNNFELEVRIRDIALEFRIRRTAGSVIGNYLFEMWAHVGWIEEVEFDQTGTEGAADNPAANAYYPDDWVLLTPAAGFSLDVNGQIRYRIESGFIRFGGRTQWQAGTAGVQAIPANSVIATGIPVTREYSGMSLCVSSTGQTSAAPWEPTVIMMHASSQELTARSGTTATDWLHLDGLVFPITSQR